MSQRVKIVEVGLRDGLQNEKVTLSINDRLELACQLARAGVKELELGAFVSPQWVPQMAGSAELFSLARNSLDLKTANLSALVPNRKGLESAIDAKVKTIAIFASASEIFSQKNINCSIKDSLTRYQEVLKAAKKAKMKVRGYLSMSFGCPFEGDVAEAKVVQLASELLKMGCYEASIGDTIGVADPVQVARLIKKLKSKIPVKKLAMHFHDTRGTALANIAEALRAGIRVFDSSVGGLGGCPYAPAATGNVATEDVCYLLHRMGYKTGIDIEALIQVNTQIQRLVGHELPSKLGRAGMPKLLK